MYRSDVIAREMRKRGLTVDSLANLINSTGFTVRRALRGGNVEVRTLHLIASGLQIEVQTLFEGVETEAYHNAPGTQKVELKKQAAKQNPSLFTDKIAA
jgi:hypothetical protein